MQQLIILRHTARFRFVKNAAVHKPLMFLRNGCFTETFNTRAKHWRFSRAVQRKIINLLHKYTLCMFEIYNKIFGGLFMDEKLTNNNLSLSKQQILQL